MYDEKLKAGAGSAEVKFPADMFPTDGLMGVHDAPHVRMIVLDCGVRVAIMAMELVNVPDDVMDECKTIISEKTGTAPENIWLHATHAITTPHAPMDPSLIPAGHRHDKPAGKDSKAEMSGPGSKPEEKKSGPSFDPEGPKKRKIFVSAVTDAVKSAAEEAAASFRPARIGTGTGICDVNTNRDIETPFGWWIGINREGPSNKTASVLRIDDLEGKIIGVFISYGIKPCAIDNSEQDKNTRLVSSDVPGAACNILEEKIKAPVLFAMSAAGDQVPREQAWGDQVNDDGTVGKFDFGVKKGLEIVDRLGSEMADDVGKIIDSIECVQEAPEIVRGGFSVSVPEKGHAPMKPSKTVSYEPNGHEAELTGDIIAIGDLALVAIKPETNVRTELELQKASPYSLTLLLSMVNGGMKYMPDQSSYDRGTWEALSSMLMPGCAEKWTQAAVQKLNEMKNTDKA